MPQFTLKVDLGHLLTIIAMIVAMVLGYGQLETRLMANAMALERIEKELMSQQQKLEVVREEQIKNSTWIFEHKKFTEDTMGMFYKEAARKERNN